MILITGASGHLASLIVTGARAAGANVITASRSQDADRVMDFDKPETLDFREIDTLFLTSAGYAENDVVIRRHAAVLDAARTQGVKHIVYSSLSRASDHLGFALAHRWTEQEIRKGDMKWTILRNGLYAELIGGLVEPKDGCITKPFGHGKISAVARADLADAALTVLMAPKAHAGQCYELSGAFAFSIDELARSIEVSYEPTSLSDERERLSKLPMLAFQPPLLMSIFSAAAAGFLKTDLSDLEKLVPTPRNALKIACNLAQKAT